MTATAPHVARHRCSWVDGYWLAHSEGYRVDGPDGHLGFVEQVVGADPDDGPTALIVRRGYGERGLAEIAIERILEIDPETEHIVVDGVPNY